MRATLPAAVGDVCELHAPGRDPLKAEVIGYDRGTARIMPFHRTDGLPPETTVIGLRQRHRVPVGPQLLGRVLNGLGEPVDGGGSVGACPSALLTPAAPPPLQRARIQTPFVTGQRVIDGLLTLGYGQRMGLFSGSGVGKSTLLGEIAKGARSDLNVIALIGERGREVRPFLDDCLGVNGRKRSVVIVSTSEETPLMRVRAAQTAVTIADRFRQQGSHVLFLVDSLTRLAMAQREIGLLIGEPPSSRGYTPSVFRLLAGLLEQLGAGATGTITAVLTVLVDGDDLDEPIADAVRGIVDGHIVLDRKLAEKDHFPAVDVGRSLSRLFPDVTEEAHQAAARKLKTILSTYAEVADLMRLGAYTPGSSAEVDQAVKLMPLLNVFLRQEMDRPIPFEQTRQVMDRIAAAWTF